MTLVFWTSFTIAQGLQPPAAPLRRWLGRPCTFCLLIDLSAEGIYLNAPHLQPIREGQSAWFFLSAAANLPTVRKRRAGGFACAGRASTATAAAAAAAAARCCLLLFMIAEHDFDVRSQIHAHWSWTESGARLLPCCSPLCAASAGWANSAATAPGWRTHSLRTGHVSGGHGTAAEVAGVVIMAGYPATVTTPAVVPPAVHPCKPAVHRCTAGLPFGLIEGMSLCGKMASVRWFPVLFSCKTAEVIIPNHSSWLCCLWAVRNEQKMLIDGCNKLEHLAARSYIIADFSLQGLKQPENLVISGTLFDYCCFNTLQCPDWYLRHKTFASTIKKQRHLCLCTKLCIHKSGN